MCSLSWKWPRGESLNVPKFGRRQTTWKRGQSGGFWDWVSSASKANRAVNFLPSISWSSVWPGLTQQQNRLVDFLIEENRTLHELLDKSSLKLSDRQRRRLAVKAKPISRKVLQEICSLVTPDTLRRWHGKLVARKYDGSQSRKPKSASPHRPDRRLLEPLQNVTSRPRSSLHQTGSISFCARQE